ncbi:GH15247 [Drosophila grimshawi]|uniref:GH15247 n=1 Tax=Drosophila grimshawi TaxID=7222 RepID=B4IX52_DROGR|nr:GH15247 [Drosophila grimshawi]
MLQSQQLLALLLIASVFLVIGSQERMAEPRIIGGHVARISHLKYLVQVLSNDAICGGSLITKRWVISAAHCVHNVPTNSLRVYGGTSEQGAQNGIQRSVTFLAVPRQFRMNTMHMDVAALYLNQDMVGPNVATIRLAFQPAPPGSLVRVSGWGATSRDSRQTARVVHSVTLPLWPNGACREAYSGQWQITRSMVCAGKSFQRDSCDGDSGGPMVYRGELIGIVSFGNECATLEPGVYTSVPVIRRWFLDIMAEYS